MLVYLVNCLQVYFSAIVTKAIAIWRKKSALVSSIVKDTNDPAQITETARAIERDNNEEQQTITNNGCLCALL